MKLTERQLAAILAGLRLLQKTVPLKDRKNLEHFNDCAPLNDTEIDKLCETINHPPVSTVLEALKMLCNVCTHPQSTKAQMRQIAEEARTAIIGS